jgi:hypothetical protein
MYNVEKPTPESKELAFLVLKPCRAVALLGGKLEPISRLFHQEMDPIQPIKGKEISETLETAIATCVPTRALSIRSGIIVSAGLNFTGAMISTKVAATIGKGVVDANDITRLVVPAGVLRFPAHGSAHVDLQEQRAVRAEQEFPQASDPLGRSNGLSPRYRGRAEVAGGGHLGALELGFPPLRCRTW